LHLDALTTFSLVTPHTVRFGIGVSFYFQADAALDSSVGSSILQITAAGGDFDRTSPFVWMLRHIVGINPPTH